MDLILKISIAFIFLAEPLAAVAQPFNNNAPAKKGYEISVQLKPYKNCKVLLAHYFGTNLLTYDSATLDENSEAVFKGEAKLHGGIYVVYDEANRGGVDFLVDANQYFSIKAEFRDYDQSILFQNSAENELLNSYKKYMAFKEVEINEYREKLHAATNLDDSAILIHELKLINDSILKVRETLVANNPKTFLSTLLRAMNEPDLPEHLKNQKNAADSAKAKYYTRLHFWDGVNFWDSRLLYTPFFDHKLEKYFSEVVDRKPDSVIQQIDWMMSTAVANEEMTRLILEKLLIGTMYHRYKWEDPVFIHLFEKYLADKTYKWLLPEDRKTFTEYAYLLIANNKGTKAYEISLPGIDGQKKSLLSINAKYTLLCFWDVTCSHCRETLPVLDSLYRTTWKKKGLKIYAVSVESEGNRDNWISYIKAYQLEEWTHVYNSIADENDRMKKGEKPVQQIYNLWYYPSFYLLDKDAHFMAKKLKYPQIAELINSVLIKE